MCLAQGPQRSDAGEAGTRGHSVSSQALYHRATALPETYSDLLRCIYESVRVITILTLFAIDKLHVMMSV